MRSSINLGEYETMPRLSSHAGARMSSRRISRDDVATVMDYGRTYYVRGALVYALGRHEAAICRKDGLRPDRIEGLPTFTEMVKEWYAHLRDNNGSHP